MNYRECVKEYYLENKKAIVFYAFAIILFSILAYGGVGAARAGELPGASAIAYHYGGSFGIAIVPLIENGFLAGIDTASIMILVSIAALTADIAKALGFMHMAVLSDYSFGIFDNRIVCIICLIWFGLPKFLKCFSKTNALGLAIEGQFAKFNGAINIILAGSQIIANVPGGVTAEAAGFLPKIGGSAINGFDAVKCIFILSLTVIVYFFIRYMSFFVDIVLLPVSTVFPTASTIFEFLKTAIVLALTALAYFQPFIFAYIFILVFIISVVLFRRAYITVRYFRNIYMRPIFKGIFGGYREDMPLNMSDGSKKMRRQLPRQIEAFAKEHSAEILIPVYLIKQIPVSLSGFATVKYDRYWLISSADGQFICKTGLINKKVEVMNFSSSADAKIFLRQAKIRPFIEIFTLAMPEEDIIKPLKRTAKKVHFVFSKEYIHRYDDIKNLTNYRDFAEYKELLKKSGTEENPGRAVLF